MQKSFWGEIFYSLAVEWAVLCEAISAVLGANLGSTSSTGETL